MIEILSRLEMTCELAGNRHLIFDNALLNSSTIAMSGPIAFSAAGARALKKTLVDISWTYLDGEEAMMDDAFQIITKQAHTVALEHLGYADAQNSMDALSARFSRSHDASKEYLNGEIVSQTNRDVNQVLRDYQNTSLRVLMTSDAQGISKEKAAVDAVMKEISTRRKLWFRDKAGRKIPSQKHIRRIWRMSLRDHWLMIYAQTLASHGITKAMIWHPDPNHKFYGREVNLMDADLGLQDRDQVFHPNARALLVIPSIMETAA